VIQFRRLFLSAFISIFALVSVGSALGVEFEHNSICGIDERRNEFFSPVGVVRELEHKDTSSYCTVTLVSDSCAVTAGHCLHLLGEAEFFASNGLDDGRMGAFKYAVVPGSVRALQTRIGNDWAVMKLKPNSKTGMLPGKVHGFVDVELNSQHESPSRLYTYSARKVQGHRFESVGADGFVLWTQGNIMFHDLDTDRGASGSLIFDAATDKAVAIHTHGGCDTMQNNKATYISQVPFLVRSIEMCRDEEGSF
jgi:V8-like Glu-specific endopeptidase